MAKIKESTIRIEEEMKEVERDDVPNYRCKICKQCEECKKSAKNKAMSRQERLEQDAIEQSVKIDYEKKQATVTLPFMKDPEQYFPKVFGDNDNRRMAEKVFVQQCKKPDHMKTEMKKAFEDLKRRGYFKKLEELPPDIKEKVQSARVKHYYP